MGAHRSTELLEQAVVFSSPVSTDSDSSCLIAAAACSRGAPLFQILERCNVVVVERLRSLRFESARRMRMLGPSASRHLDFVLRRNDALHQDLVAREILGELHKRVCRCESVFHRLLP